MSRRKKSATLRRDVPGATLVDLTSKGEEPWVRFSPFFPHGGIPVPFTPGRVSQSVEGIWQGLKVFQTSDVDPARFDIESMKGIKRTCRRYGTCLGHRKGLEGDELLSYRDARRVIYLPTYLYVLKHRLQNELDELDRIVRGGPLVLLDYETNIDVDDLSRPLSHAGLVKLYLENRWP